MLELKEPLPQFLIRYDVIISPFLLFRVVNLRRVDILATIFLKQNISTNTNAFFVSIDATGIR